MDQILEEWRPVKGYEDKYEVSSAGRVRSLSRTVAKSDGRTYTVKERILKQINKKPYGHQRVFLSKNGRLTSYYVHCLVAEAFLGSRPTGMYVCHGPNGTADNSVANLAYQTPVHNQADRRRDGTYMAGSACTWAKLNEDDVRDIRNSAQRGVPQTELALLYGISKASVCNIVNRKVWRHVG